jgi:hypothetical protein
VAKTKLKSLPKSKNGTRRKTFSAGAYQFQKDELRRRAHKRGMSVSRYLNELLWHDWLIQQEKPRGRKK